MSIDRRVSRTRTALYDGLVALILRKDYDEISIRDVLNEANVGRSTFYAHFRSKDELLERSLERLRTQLIERHRQNAQKRASAEERSASPSLAFFEHVNEYRRIYSLVAGKRAGVIIINAVHDALIAFMKQSGIAPAIEGVPPELGAEYLTGTLLVVMTWWLERKPKLLPLEVDAIYSRLVSK